MRSISFFLLAAVSIVALTGMRKHEQNDAMSSWVKLSGSDGKDINVNEKGQFALVNTADKLYVYEGPTWKELTYMKGTKFYAENKGIKIWYEGRCIHYLDCIKQGVKIGGSSRKDCAYPDPPIDLAIDSDSTIWHIDSYTKELYAMKCRQYISIPKTTNARRIAAGANAVWMIDNQGKIFQLKDRVHPNMGWEQKPGGDARDITVSNEGYVFMVDNKGRIYQWTGFRWDQIDGSDGLRIAANNRKLLLMNTQREMYTRAY